MDAETADLLRVLEKVLHIVTTFEQDVTWNSGWDTPADMVTELQAHADRLRSGDLSKLDDLRFLFLPTGPLQEVSISSGWAEVFLTLSEHFDHAYAALRPKP